MLDHRHHLSPEEFRQAKSRARVREQDRIDEREHLRLEIPTRAILERMGATIATFIQGYEDVTTAMGDIIQQPLTRERIAALKAASDIDKTLLDRVLPALKAVEPEKQEELMKDPASLTDNELRQTLAKYMGLDPTILARLDAPPMVDTPVVDFSIGRVTLQ